MTNIRDRLLVTDVGFYRGIILNTASVGSSQAMATSYQIPSLLWSRAIAPKVKRPGREAEQSSLTRAEVQEHVDLYIYYPQYVFMG
jgi:hypothetical protein